MLDYHEWIDRFERLSASEVGGSIARSGFVPGATVGLSTQVLAYLQHLAGRWARRRPVIGCEIPAMLAEVHRADQLFEQMEYSEVGARFVPDWADDSFKNVSRNAGC